jgi:hypothetical protein
MSGIEVSHFALVQEPSCWDQCERFHGKAAHALISPIVESQKIDSSDDILGRSSARPERGGNQLSSWRQAPQPEFGTKMRRTGI